MSYDGVDRLVNAGTASIGYDDADNITSLRTTTGSLNYNYSGNRLSSVSGFKSYNFSYDSNGNVTSNGNNTFDYDGASNLRSVSGTTSAVYEYDGKNQRVHAVRNGQDIYYFYGQGGMLLGEYDAQGTWVKEYAYLGPKLIAMAENIPDIAPGVPASITVPATSDTGSYVVTWGAASGNVTRYELQEATVAEFSNATVAYSGTALSWPATVKTDGTYYYRVRACNGMACSNYVAANNGVVVTVLVIAPGIPSSITVPATSTTGTYNISWSAAIGTVTHYELQEGTEPSFSCYMWPCPPGRFCTQICGLAPTIYSGPNLSVVVGSSIPKVNRTYYYRVRACNGTACSSYVTGANGVVVSIPITAAPGLPSSISVPLNGVGGSYFISWGSSTGTVTAYELYESTSSISNPMISKCLIPPCPYIGGVYVGMGLSTQITGKTSGTYYYSVRACNVQSCSDFVRGANGVVVP